MYKHKKFVNLSLLDLAEFISADIIVNNGSEQQLSHIVLKGVATLENAQANDLSFYTNRAYKDILVGTCAGAVVTDKQNASLVPTIALVVNNPHYAYSRALEFFVNRHESKYGVHPSAIIGKNTKVADTAYVGPFVVIGDNTTISNNVIIDSHCIIGNNCTIGSNTKLFSRVTLYDDVRIGSSCLLHSGAVLGADGFGFALSHNKTWSKVEQLGGVQIGNNVEIGANTTIDCGALNDTIIKDGVKLDNQIQIGHNVIIGEHCILAGQAAIAGSTKVGKYCAFGGASSIAGHLTISDGVSIAGTGVVGQSINEPGVYASGTGSALPFKKWRRMSVILEQLERYIKEFKQIEKTHNSQ